MSRREQAGLYVHVPFCRTKCPYCDFYSRTDLTRTDAWLEALEQEADLYRGRFGTFDTLYLGGGTPSLLGEREMSSLVEGILRRFVLSPGAEITVEANPDDITPQKLSHLRALGFNRISLGVQSLEERELRCLNRRHTARRALKALEYIRASGFPNLGMDLMYGIPGQSESAWITTLERALEFHPEHLSCYQLTCHSGTPFGEMRDRGEIPALGEERERSFFLLTSRYLEGRGYVHYEVSNFAWGESFISRHNSKYWRRVPYLGLGPSAHSFAGGRRWWNVASLSDYCRALASARSPVAGRERLSGDQSRLESLALGFRTREGVDMRILGDRPEAGRILRELETSGLVALSDNRAVPTREGLVVADSLPLLFCH